LIIAFGRIYRGKLKSAKSIIFASNEQTMQ